MNAEKLIDAYLEGITVPASPAKWQVPPDKKRRKEISKADVESIDRYYESRRYDEEVT